MLCEAYEACVRMQIDHATIPACVGLSGSTPSSAADSTGRLSDGAIANPCRWTLLLASGYGGEMSAAAAVGRICYGATSEKWGSLCYLRRSAYLRRSTIPLSYWPICTVCVFWSRGVVCCAVCVARSVGRVVVRCLVVQNQSSIY